MSVERCERSPSWILLRRGHHLPSLQHSTLTGPGGPRAETPRCLVFPCTEFSQSPAKSIAGKSGAEQHG